MTQPGPNYALSQNSMMLGLLVASENVNKQIHKIYVLWEDILLNDSNTIT